MFRVLSSIFWNLVEASTENGSPNHLVTPGGAKFVFFGFQIVCRTKIIWFQLPPVRPDSWFCSFVSKLWRFDSKKFVSLEYDRPKFSFSQNFESCSLKNSLNSSIRNSSTTQNPKKHFTFPIERKVGCLMAFN